MGAIEGKSSLDAERLILTGLRPVLGKTASQAQSVRMQGRTLTRDINSYSVFLSNFQWLEQGNQQQLPPAY